MTALGAALAAMLSRDRLDAVYVFGSRAADVAAAVRGDLPLAVNPGSDIDIGVLPRPGNRLDAEARVGLVMALESVFDGARVDLVVVPEAPAFLALDVVSGELLAVGDRDRVAEYELYVLRRAGDLAPFERERRRMILSGEAR